MITGIRYAKKRLQELRQFRNVENVHNLPDIFHYWSNNYLKEMLDSVDIQSVNEFFVSYIVDNCKKNESELIEVVSIGSGNCDTEVALAKLALNKGVKNFHIDCLDLNSHMLARGRELARENGVSDFLGFEEADINGWNPAHNYKICIAHQSLHHIQDLEILFLKVQQAIHQNGIFLTSDIIGRNGHMRWPEALDIIDGIWEKMPDSYKYNHILKRYEERYENWDCSTAGFEGVRAQDILPLLIENFHFEKFLAFGNIIDIFVDRAFGHNFDTNSDEDRAFIDYVAQLDQEKIDKGHIKPTHIIAAMRTAPVATTLCYKHWTPEFCLRKVR